METETSIVRRSPEEYGGDYQLHYLELYKLYVEMADRISARRQSSNSFFLTVNTAVIGFVAYLQLGDKAVETGHNYWLVSLAGIALCYTWARLIRSYRNLNSGNLKSSNCLNKSSLSRPMMRSGKFWVKVKIRNYFCHLAALSAMFRGSSLSCIYLYSSKRFLGR